MSFIKTIFKSIFKNKVVLFCLILQFTLCYFISMRSYSTYKIMNSQVDNINKYIDIKSTYLMKQNDGPSTFFDGSFPKFLKNAESLKGVKSIGAYYVKELKSTSSPSNMVCINYHMLDFLKLQFDDGRCFNPEDFKDSEKDYSTVPIIIGYNLKSKYKINDTIRSEGLGVEKCNFQVIGTLKSDQTFLGTHILNEKLVNLDNSFIVPANFSMSQFMNSYSNLFISVDPHEKSIAKNIKLLGKQYNVSFHIDNVNDLVDRQYEQDLVLFKNYLLIATFLLVFSLFGVAVTMIMFVESRKREFGIRLAGGSTKSYIYRLILGEIFTMNILGFLIGMFLFKLSEGSLINLFVSGGFIGIFNFKVICIILLISFILIFLFSLESARRIYKLEPRELIKGCD